jgi:hypothetical protein
MKHFKETTNLLENSSFYYTIAIGMDNKYMHVSPNYDKNFSFINKSLLGQPFYITLHPDDIKICAEVAGKCFADPGLLFPATLRKHDGKGGFIFTQWEFKALFNDNHEPGGIFCIGHNITEYIDTQNKLQTAKTEIDNKIDQLNEIGFMQSHVIRKPLANIMGLINILAVMDVDGNLQNIHALLIESAKELDSVIKTITDKTA